jgi:hypothetical protein
MRFRIPFSIAFLLLIAVIVVACTGGPTSLPSATQPPATGSDTSPASPASSERLSAREAMTLAYASLPDEWQSTARLAFIGRYSRYCDENCSPLVVEDDPGIGADGRQAHWVVIFAKDESASPASVFYVEVGKTRLVTSDLAIILPDDLFTMEGWVDSTEIRFRTTQPVGLALRTNNLFEDVDAELAGYSLLWLAETSFGRYDVYNAQTGQFIKSR